jgi:2-keto-4-pentenoate hydratase/2-oxohepta-3-ene-1,7-dioic acid hydratase in catechol pathway
MIEQQGRLLDLQEILGDELSNRISAPVTDLMPLLNHWRDFSSLLDSRVRAYADEFKAQGVGANTITFLPPLASPGKIICIGSNYHDHIAEMGIPMLPQYPYSFLKPANNTIRASGQPVDVPQGVKMMDWEAELAVVIGCQCRNVSAADALSVVAGYCNFNDLSARDWLASRPAVGIDWIWHKAFDGFAPMGPYFVPSRFIPDPQNLPIRLSVNGADRQRSTTGQMIFGVAAVIEHLTSIMTLFPGDVIATGTPAGVGHGRTPPEYLTSGDIIRMEIGPLGELETPIA